MNYLSYPFLSDAQFRAHRPSQRLRAGRLADEQAMKVGTSRMSGWGPYTGLRTEHASHPEPTPRQRRTCQCGTVLSSGNYSDTCCQCAIGHVDIPEWAATLAELNPAQTALDFIARVLTGDKADPAWRKHAIRRAFENGAGTKAELSRLWGVGWSSINEDVRREREET